MKQTPEPERRPTLDDLIREQEAIPEQFGPPRPPKFNRKNLRIPTEAEIRENFPDLFGKAESDEKP